MRQFSPEYLRYLKSSEWRKKADSRLAFDGGKCQVCGKKATEVHHLTYDRLGHEELSDIVSLCKPCHKKAEELYEFEVTPYGKRKTSNFMAAMRIDTANLAPVVFDWLKETRGAGFDALMELRQPDDAWGKDYWGVLRKAVDALCRKRYRYACAEDRVDIAEATLSNRVIVMCVQRIEHYVRNGIQSELQGIVQMQDAIWENQKEVASFLGIKESTCTKLRKDDGVSFGSSLREEVLHYCGEGAAHGLKPIEGFECLTDKDYEMLNSFAEYVVSVSGTGRFKG